MILVPRHKTPVPLDELPGALRQAHREAFAFEPCESALELAFAMLCYEAGVSGGLLRGVYNENLGNHDATAEERAAGPVFQTVSEREVIGGHSAQRIHVRPSYDDAESGAVGWWHRLREGFVEAYEAMQTGTVRDFAIALKSRGYYTSDAGSYARGLALWVAEYQRRWPSGTGSEFYP